MTIPTQEMLDELSTMEYKNYLRTGIYNAPDGGNIFLNGDNRYTTVDNIKGKYTVLLSQSGTTAPTETILNDTITGLVWTRTTGGTYVLTKTGAFTADKTIPNKTEPYTDADGNYMTIERTDADTITLKTYAAIDTEVLADGVLNKQFINIEIYN